MYSYLLVNIFSFLVPFLVSFHPRNGFIKHWKALLWALLIVSFFFIGWDILFTYKNVWGFTPQYVTGVYIANLPIEEIMFFFCIPYSCLFTYQVFKDNSLLPQIPLQVSKAILYVLLIFSVLMFLLYYNRAYPSVTFASLFGLTVYSIYNKKFQFVIELVISYLVLLVPFIIVNGILTGSFLNRIIVWYNPTQIIGIRILTIPLEDVFYGFVLFSLNAFLFEYKKNRIVT